MIRRTELRWLFVAAAALLLGGCSQLAYYAQAIHGHSQLMFAARPVPDLLADPSSPAPLRQQLMRSQEIRDFASRELGLPDNGSYRRYVAVGRPYVVWNVFAAPEFSLQAKTWCLLVVGCVGYRGYFDRAAAESLAGSLRAEGFDVVVAGVPAYSTLGHFDDPLLDTFLRHGDLEVARLIFHELAHQVVYLAGDSTFSESFASAVEEEGLRRWLAARGTAAQREAWAVRRQRRGEFMGLVDKTRQELVAAYAAATPEAARREAKAAIFTKLRQDYAALKASWGGARDYDAWIAEDLNNARLVSLSLYTRRVPAFAALIAELKGDLPAFYRRVGELAKLSPEARTAELDKLM